MTDILGYTAAAIGTFLMVPQVFQSIKTKSVKDLSSVMLAAYIVQSVLWCMYGILLHATPVAAGNAIAFFIGVFQVYLKWHYRQR